MWNKIKVSKPCTISKKDSDKGINSKLIKLNKTTIKHQIYIPYQTYHDKMTDDYLIHENRVF